MHRLCRGLKRHLHDPINTNSLAKAAVPADIVKVSAQGAQAAADSGNVKSQETYIGYERAENFESAGGSVPDKPNAYAAAPSELALNHWDLRGDWTVGSEKTVLDHPNGALRYRFHARDLHLVLGPSADGKPVRFRVTLDGQAPGANHGVDIDADGNGAVSAQRL